MILIVDDKPENIFALKSTLEVNNFKVDTATSGEEALHKILKADYMLVILDVQMPEMDGFEVAEMILSYSKSKDTPIIFLSAISKEKKFITKGYKTGAMDYITKPVDPDILLLKVASFYAMSQQKNELKRIQAVLLEEAQIRERSQNELEAKNQELQSVMESMPQIAFTINVNGEVEYVNKKWLECFGPGKQFPELHPHNKEICERWNNSFIKGEEFTEEVKVKSIKTTDYGHFLLKIIPVIQHNGIAKWVGTFTDIDKQKLANELLELKVEERTIELLKKNKALELSNKELKQVSWVLSHDLKEPVRKILTYGNLIKDQQLISNEKALPYLNRILDSSERMGKLINDLLDFSRLPESSDLQIIDLNKVIEDVTADLEIKIEKLKAKLKVDKLPAIQASENQMRQLFQNLIDNALKFSKPDQAPLISITCEIITSLDFNSAVSDNGNYCRIKISDKGVGFDKKFLDKIFLVFQRLHTTNVEGTGIGLAIVKKIVETHHGIITANSLINEGTNFIIVLPLKQI